MIDKTLEEINKRKFKVYIISCCLDDRLELMELEFNKQKAITIWENFTGKDYEEYLESQIKNIYDYSETAGTKINEFECKLSEVLSL